MWKRGAEGNVTAAPWPLRVMRLSSSGLRLGSQTSSEKQPSWQRMVGERHGWQAKPWGRAHGQWERLKQRRREIPTQPRTWSSVPQVSWADSYLQSGLPAGCCPSHPSCLLYKPRHLLGTATSMEKNQWRSHGMKNIIPTPWQGPRHPSCLADPSQGKRQRGDKSKTKQIRQTGTRQRIEVGLDDHERIFQPE